LSIDDLRMKFIELLDALPSACRYHDPKYEKRIYAAQQLTRDEIQEIRSGVSVNEIYSMTRKFLKNPKDIIID